jgi:predicted metal-dependent phosphotriesterase family hydrolase
MSPLHTDGLVAFMNGLRAEGISDEDIDLMIRRNPARLLGLDP